MKSPLALLLAAIVFTAASPVAVAEERADPAADAAAAAKVERIQNELLAVMRGGEALGFTGRRARLAPVFRETFDVPYVTRLLLGRHWRGLDDERKARFEDIVFRLATGTFASRFSSYSGEQFEFEFARPLKKGNWRQVRTWFLRAEGERLRLDYAVRRSGDDWRIIDVYYDGVSGTRIQRNEFTAVIEKDGVDALMNQLEEKIAELGSDES